MKEFRIIGIVLIIGAVLFINPIELNNDSNQVVEKRVIKEYVLEIEDISLDIPFISQAPFEEWNNPVYQDGCEEAAALMAVYWALNKDLNKEIAQQEILAISNYEQENFGTYMDTSVYDTVERIIKGYFGYNNVEVKEVNKINDIIKEIEKNRAVIIPANGQLLNNPYFTLPGPERHNLVIRGYDSENQEFIVNDPGTKKGQEYRYSQEVLFNSIRDYPTGNHKPIINQKKFMIVVKRIIL